MLKRKAKKGNTKVSTDGGHFRALVEDVRDQLRGVAENVVGVHTKLDGHSKILNEHTKILGEHSRILDVHTEMIGNIMVDVETIKNEMKQKVDRDEFKSLVRRVTVLESKVRK